MFCIGSFLPQKLSIGLQLTVLFLKAMKTLEGEA
jgi:hypothetical protein